MKEVKIETRVDSNTILRIRATGKSVYEFLQEAVNEKLNHDEKLFERQFHEFQKKAQEENKKFQKEIENIMIISMKTSREFHDESLRKDEVYKEKTLELLRKISAHLK